MAAEARLWQWLRERLQSGHFTRVESETSPGVPDVNYCVQGSEGWIELKAAKRATGKPFKKRGLRPEQIRWIMTHLAHGGTVWIIASIGSSVYAFSGSLAHRFNDSSVEDLMHEARWVARRRGSTPGDFELLTAILEGQ